MQVEEKLLVIIKKIVGIDDISLETPVDGDIISSFNYVKLIVSIEEEFEIEIPDEYLDVSQFETVKDIAGFIHEVLDKE